MNVEYIDNDFNMFNFNLGWNVLAEEGVQVDQSVILPYMLDDVVIDEAGAVVSTTPVTDLAGRLQTYSGKSWVY